MKFVVNILMVLFMISSTVYSSLLFDVNDAKTPVGVDNPSDTLFIVGVRFEFQKEIYEQTITSGDGTFEYDAKSQYSIDPTPHNREYFENHFKSASKYFNKSSNGKLVIKYKVFPEISQKSYQLPQEMKYYSPETKDGEEKSDSLMSLVRDVLKETKSPKLDEVSSFYKSMQLKESDNFKVAYCFIHAGAFGGTDGIVTNYPDSPSDIFSAYISSKDFSIYSHKIAQYNSLNLDRMIILPERATQDQPEFENNKRTEFAINGLLAYQIYKTLGLPDLFDIKKGESEVGVFSPLDYSNYINAISSGAFVVEPSAFEKDFLGWGEIVEVNPYKQSKIEVKKDAILKVRLNNNEDILFELKGRKAKTTKIWMNNGTTHVIDTASLYYNHKTNYSIKGIIDSCENYDFSLPAYGVVAWAINNDKIAKDFDANEVNVADRGVYGVKVLEADGKMDIGDIVYDAIGNPTILTGNATDVFQAGDSSYLELLSQKNPLELTFKLEAITDSSYIISFSKFMTSDIDSLTTEKSLANISQDTVVVNGEIFLKDSDVKSWAFITRNDVEDLLVAKVLSSGELILEDAFGRDVPVDNKILDAQKVLTLKSGDNYYLAVFKDSTYEVYNSNLKMVKFKEDFYSIIRERAVFPRYYSSIENVYIAENYIADFKEKKSSGVRHNLSVVLSNPTFLGLNGEYSLAVNTAEKKEIERFFMYPNPVSKKATGSVVTFTYNSKFNPSKGSIKIYSLTGEKVDEISVTTQKGWNSVEYSVRRLYNDVYVAILNLDGVQKKFKFAIRE